jgi:hypothetical protein
VVTSGDFGLAYLTERWAARFVSELFRNYVVCFVGYSINDPVLRYMMDALAADRMLGEVTPQAWALGDSEPGQEARKTVEWEAKGVAPILYPVPAGTHDHSALHQTLQAWAETYRDGVTGKERIVVAHALARPSASTRQDDFVGRMLWALSDRPGCRPEGLQSSTRCRRWTGCWMHSPRTVMGTPTLSDSVCRRVTTPTRSCVQPDPSPGALPARAADAAGCRWYRGHAVGRCDAPACALAGAAPE